VFRRGVRKNPPPRRNTAETAGPEAVHQIRRRIPSGVSI
jgi:hypothetical protein